MEKDNLVKSFHEMWDASVHSFINQSLNTDCNSSGFKTSIAFPVYLMIPSSSSFFISL